MRIVQGFSLVEVLITAFILATGLLGVIAMQGWAKQSSYEARQRTHAAFIAHDIIERIRMNGGWLFSTPTASYTGTYGAADLEMPTCSSVTGNMNGCTGEETRDHDLYHWQQMLQGAEIVLNDKNIAGLASAVGCISDDADTGRVRVVISWLSRQGIKDALDTGDSALEAACGSASKKRRQLSLESYVR